MRGGFLDKVMFVPNLSTLGQGCFSHRSRAEKFSYQIKELPRAPVADEVSLPDNGSDVANVQPEMVLDDAISRSKKRQDSENSVREIEDFILPDLVEICPPGGINSIVLYSTSLRSILRTFEDCQTIRSLLTSFRLPFYERDVSMHLEFREELWSLLKCKAIPPRLFIKGKYVGGANEVVTLHEQGKLSKLVEGIPTDPLINQPCNSCGNLRFLVCAVCYGSRKVITENHTAMRCPHCNENGLARCIFCSH